MRAGTRNGRRCPQRAPRDPVRPGERTAPARIQPSTASYCLRCSSDFRRPETTVPSQPYAKPRGIDTSPVVVNGNQLKSASGNAEVGEPETRLVPVIRTRTVSEPPMRVHSRPVRV